MERGRMTLARIPVETAARAAAMQLLADYVADVGVTCNVYPGRPIKGLLPPVAWVDAIGETLQNYTITHRQRTVQPQVLVVHGVYDYADTVAQRDAFMDGFLDWCADRYHAAGGNTLLAPVLVNDEPDWVPAWLPPEQQRVYYATRITLEVFAAT